MAKALYCQNCGVITNHVCIGYAEDRKDFRGIKYQCKCGRVALYAEVQINIRSGEYYQIVYQEIIKLGVLT